MYDVDYNFVMLVWANKVGDFNINSPSILLLQRIYKYESIQYNTL